MTIAFSRRTYYLGDADEAAITRIKERYGLSTDSDAVRLALRLVVASKHAELPQATPASASAKGKAAPAARKRGKTP